MSPLSNFFKCSWRLASMPLSNFAADMMVQVVVAVAHDGTDYRSCNRYLFSVAQNKLQKGNVFNIKAGKQVLRNINSLSLFLNIDLEVALKGSAYENSLIYKERTKRLHDAKIKNRIFNVGDQVLLFNSRLKIFSGKLKSCWSGPFTISEIYPYETAKLVHPDGCNFKVNCHRLKHYHGGDPPPLEIPDFHTFPKDN
nr:reverse transcriptase domain-containing protein [Tanacetum cinerariifolium]